MLITVKFLGHLFGSLKVWFVVYSLKVWIVITQVFNIWVTTSDVARPLSYKTKTTF